MSQRVVRSRRPDASEALHYDNTYVPQALHRFIAHNQSFLPAPDNLYAADHKPRLEEAKRLLGRAVTDWSRSADGRGAAWDPNVFPRRTLRDNGSLIGVDFLQNLVPGERKDWDGDLPMPLDPDGTYSTLSSFATFAFMLQNDLWNFVSPRIDLHVLTKGLDEFNTDGRRPRFMGSELVTYVHTEHNLDAYIRALIASDAFRTAVNSPMRAGATMRRIVVPILLTGHYQVFGWDRVFLSPGVVHDRLFVMTSMLPEVFPIDPHASENIMREFSKQLVDGGFIQKLPEITPYPGAGYALRDVSLRSEFNDTGCFQLSMLYTFFLAMSEDINTPNPSFLNTSVWNAFRASFEVYQRRLIGLLEAHAAHNIPLLFGPSWNAQFLNIRDARLSDTDGHQYVYSSENGWMLKH
jgi:hypothetical protein